MNINECETNICGGYPEQVCTDLIGSFTCACGAGFSGSTTTGSPAECSDINECEFPNNPCSDENSIQLCINTIGSFNCSCGNGYSGETNSGQPAECENINECLTSPCANSGLDVEKYQFKSISQMIVVVSVGD